MKYYNGGKRFMKLWDAPTLIALSVNFFIVFLIEQSVLKNTGFVFMYPLDDPFIHMQVAKNLSYFGTWGINAEEFASASSSLLYTLLLAAIFKIFTVHVIVPFIINCLASVVLLVVINKWLIKEDISALLRSVILLAVTLLAPLPVLVVSGMEHILQSVFCFLFLVSFSECLKSDKGIFRLPWYIYLYALIVVGLRYEGMFLVFVACLLLIYYRRIGSAISLGGAALIPVIVFGIYSVYVGSYFFPNSVLVKSEGVPFSLSGLATYIYNILVNKLTLVKSDSVIPGNPSPGISLLSTQRLLIILPLVACFFAGQIKQKMNYLYILLVLSITIVLHLSFAATGWFYRYEAYLVISSFVILPVIVIKFGKFSINRPLFTNIFYGVLIFSLFFPFLLRSSAAYSKAARACINIYQQQYQMARFIKMNYNNSVVAANDIGAIAYFTNARIVDLWGLGSIEVARSKKKKYWTPVFLDSLVKAKNTKVAIVYDEWFSPELLKKWKKVATWQISDNVICGSDKVCFYAIDEHEREALSRKLHDFKFLTGEDIKVSYP